MNSKVDLNAVYALSEDVVMRKIDGETILVPIGSGIGDLEDDLYTVNESGLSILSMLDGKRTLKDVAMVIGSQYEADEESLIVDVLGFTSELYRRKMIVEAQ